MRLLLGLLLAASLTGCSTPVVDVDQIMSHEQCQNVKTGVSVISMADMAALRGSRLLGTAPEPVAEQGSQGLLYAVYTGPKPTAGYALRLDRVEQQKSAIHIHVQTLKPAPDLMVSQVITQPCVVVRVQGLPDDYSSRFYVDGDVQTLHAPETSR